MPKKVYLFIIGLLVSHLSVTYAQSIENMSLDSDQCTNCFVVNRCSELIECKEVADRYSDRYFYDLNFRVNSTMECATNSGVRVIRQQGEVRNVWSGKRFKNKSDALDGCVSEFERINVGISHCDN